MIKPFHKAEKALLRLPLEKRWFLLIVMGAVVISLVVINNYFYYQSIDKNEEKLQLQLLNTLKAAVGSCVETQSSASTCEKLLIDIVQESKWKGIVTVRDSEGTVILNNNNQAYREHRNSVTNKKSINISESGQNAVTVEIDTKSSYYLPVSVFNSVTLSLPDIARQLTNGRSLSEIYGFVMNVAIPRSRPFLFFLALGFLSYTVARVGLRQSALKLNQAERENEDVLKELDSIKAVKDELESDLDAKDRELADVRDDFDSLQEEYEREKSEYDNSRNSGTSSQELKRREKEISRLKEKLDAASSKNDELAAEWRQVERELEARRAEIKGMESLEQENSERIEKLEATQPDPRGTRERIIRALTRNPTLAKVKMKRVNPGKHHSKDFLGALCEQIENHKSALSFIKAVHSSSYRPREKGQILPGWDSSKEEYCLFVVQNDDEGYCAQVMVAADAQWEVIMAAKCMVNAIPSFKKYTITDKSTVV